MMQIFRQKIGRRISLCKCQIMSRLDLAGYRDFTISMMINQEVGKGPLTNFEDQMAFAFNRLYPRLGKAKTDRSNTGRQFTDHLRFRSLRLLTHRFEPVALLVKFLHDDLQRVHRLLPIIAAVM